MLATVAAAHVEEGKAEVAAVTRELDSRPTQEVNVRSCAKPVAGVEGGISGGEK